MSRAITAVLLLFLYSGLLSCGRSRLSDVSDSASVDNIGVTATVDDPGRAPQLRFTIHNLGADPITIPHRFLPWGGNSVNWGKNPVLLLTAKSSTGRMLQPSFPVSELAPDNQVTLPPNTAVEGFVPLIPYFADMQEEADRPVTLYWSFRLPHDGGTEDVFSGSLLLR